MSIGDTEQLELIIKSLSSDLAFYQDAAVRAERSEHQEIFKRMAVSRAFAVEYLKPFAQGGTNDRIHAFGSLLHKMYPEILSGLDPTQDANLIEESNRVEAEALKVMRAALEKIESPLIKSILKDLCPRINGNPYCDCWDKVS